MNRPIKEVELPISKWKVGLYLYYTRGDRVAIERIMSDSTEFDERGNVTKVSAGYLLDMDNEAVLRAVKFIKTKDGVDLEIKMDTVNELPEEDFEFLRGYLPKQDKKKLTTKPSEDTSKQSRKKEE